MHYLYQITNRTKNKKYIGVTKNPRYRKARHFCGYGNKLLAEDLEDDLVFQVLVCGDERYIYDLEVKAISLFNTLFPFGYNISQGGEVGPSMKGSTNPNAKLTEDDVIDIRMAYAEGKTAVDLAKKYNISRSNIGTIVRGENWITTPGPITIGKRVLVSKKESQEIKELQKAGLSHTEIAKNLNRSVATILLHMEL